MGRSAGATRRWGRAVRWRWCGGTCTTTRRLGRRRLPVSSTGCRRRRLSVSALPRLSWCRLLTGQPVPTGRRLVWLAVSTRRLLAGLPVSTRRLLTVTLLRATLVRATLVRPALVRTTLCG
ncbi:MAG: hypothetical protein WKF51_02000, partial [Geodermatophilaceae bacterium]